MSLVPVASRAGRAGPWTWCPASRRPAARRLWCCATSRAAASNTIEVTWPGAGAPGGPRLWFVATRSACSAFPREVALDPSSPCAVLAEAGQRHDGPLVSSMTVTHGRGNPAVLGTPPDYRVWIVNDATAPTPFTLDARWSFGPDC